MEVIGVIGVIGPGGPSGASGGRGGAVGPAFAPMGGSLGVLFGVRLPSPTNGGLGCRPCGAPVVVAILVSFFLHMTTGLFPAPAHAEGSSILVGALWDLSGKGQREGGAALQAARQAIEGINSQGGAGGRPLELVVVDTGDEPGQLLARAQGLFRSGPVAAIIGPAAETSPGQLVAYAEARETPVVLVAGDEVLLPSRTGQSVRWAFQVSPTRAAVIRALYQAASRSGQTRVGLLVADDEAGKQAVLWLKAYATEYRQCVVATVFFDAKDTDMRSQLEEVRGAGAQIVVVWGNRESGPAVVRSARGLGLPLAMPPGSLSAAVLQALSPGQDLWVVLPPLLAREALAPSHPCAFPAGTYASKLPGAVMDQTHQPFLAGGGAWDAVHLLAAAMRHAPAPTPSDIRQALEELPSPYAGVLGVFKPTARDHSGLDPSSLVVARWRGGRWEPVSRP